MAARRYQPEPRRQDAPTDMSAAAHPRFALSYTATHCHPCRAGLRAL